MAVAPVSEKKSMSMRVLKFFGVASLALIGAGFGLGATPASAGCGYTGCGGYGGYAAAVVVAPPPVVVEPVTPVYAYGYQSGCGCGAGYYPAYTYPSTYGVAVEEEVVVGPRYYRPRAYGPRYYGPRRYGSRYYGRRPVVARY
jgi:hypothetical protein